MSTTPPVRPRAGDPTFGPTCVCGNTKAKQAWTCQPCHSKLRGYGEAARVSRLVGVVPTRVERLSTLEAARLSSSGELATLIAEQFTDDSHGQIGNRRVLSLDGVDCYGRPLYEVIAA